MSSKRVHGEESCGNIFQDLQVKDAEENLVKADLVFRINHVLERRKLKQSESAKLLGISQPKVSDLKRGVLSSFSTEKLMGFLSLLRYDVTITLRKTRRPGHGKIKVCA